MPAARPAASSPIAARLPARPSACAQAGSPVDSTCPAYSGSAKSSARATSALSAAASPSASGPSAAALDCGCRRTTVTMLVFYGLHGLADRLAEEPGAEEAPDGRSAVESGDARVPVRAPLPGGQAPA